jgi:hypothetical protein
LPSDFFIFSAIYYIGLRYKWMICDGDSSAYEAVKNLYMTADDDDEDGNQESKDTYEGIIQHLVIFPSVQVAIVIHTELLF